MARGFRIAHRLKLAREHLGWMSIHAPRMPVLADAIAKAAEDFKKVETLLHASTHKRPDGFGADAILKPVEQRLRELLANVETQLCTRRSTLCRVPENEGVVAHNAPSAADFRKRIALVDSDVVRLRAVATHPSARDVLAVAAATLKDASQWLCGDLSLEVVERIERALDLAAWRVQVVQQAVDRFGPAAIVEIVEWPRARR